MYAARAHPVSSNPRTEIQFAGPSFLRRAWIGCYPALIEPRRAGDRVKHVTL